jgi:hypothetical protein
VAGSVAGRPGAGLATIRINPYRVLPRGMKAPSASRLTTCEPTAIGCWGKRACSGMVGEQERITLDSLVVIADFGEPRLAPRSRESRWDWTWLQRDNAAVAWSIERLVHFGPDDFLVDGFSHFGFHDRGGRQFAISHPGHVMGLVGPDGRLAWTAGRSPRVSGIPHLDLDLEFPMFVDCLPDGSLVVSTFTAARLYQLDAEGRWARLLVDGHALGMADMGNAVVDDAGDIWVNEVTGCRVWRFDASGRAIETIGDGTPGSSLADVSFEDGRFGWIYDLRRTSDGRLRLLDSSHYMLRAIDATRRIVTAVAGTGQPGPAIDGVPAMEATFGSDPGAQFDGPISLSVDDTGNAFVGDRQNHVVRRIDAQTGTVTTIAGRLDSDAASVNDSAERDPRRLNLPMISSMDWHSGRLFVPTDLADGGDLAILRET